jgi:hypothetical protein
MKFVAPEMEIKMFSTEDVLTASGETVPAETTTSMYQPDCPAELPMD